MVKRFTLFLSLFASFTLSAQNINIPDDNFKQALINNPEINTNLDLEISVAEAAAYSGVINLYSKSISVLTGIEHFINITELDCSDNQLSSLDVSKNTKLTYLYCSYNPLNNLDVRKNTLLINLECTDINLSSLGLSNNTELTHLNISNNQISIIDLNQNTKLQSLTCSNNQLSSLDINNNVKLSFLRCDNNLINSLDLSMTPLISNLKCDNNQLRNLDLSANISLAYLNLSTNQLNNLDVSNNKKLWDLNCSNNELTHLDVSNNTGLFVLNCSNNKIPFSDLSKIKNNFSTLSYSSTKRIFTSLKRPVDYEVDYSAEASIGGNETTFTWYNSDNNVVNDEFLSKVSAGVYKFLQRGIYYCKMTNATFTGTELTTELITINNTPINFPDANFKQALLNDPNINVNGDTEISEGEAAAFDGQMYVYDKNISSLAGIEYFSSLKYLMCTKNPIDHLDVSKNLMLEVLTCSKTNISEFNLKNNTLLRHLGCYGSNVTNLDLSSNPKLTYLDCAYNQLSELDISNNTELTDIRCSYNELTKWDISNNKKLERVDCEKNRIPLSELIKIKEHFPGLNDCSQTKVYQSFEEDSGFEIDYSTEFLINGEETTFTWYDVESWEITTDNSIIAQGNGKFKFSKPGKFHCRMENTTIPSTEIITNTITIRKHNQSITFLNPPTLQKVNDVVTLEVEASSGLEVVLTKQWGFASLEGNTLTFNRAGTVRIKAVQKGNTEFNPTGKTIDIKVEKKEQSITFSELPEKLIVGDVLELEATASTELEVKYEIISGYASITGNKLTASKEGMIELKAIQEGDDEFLPAEESITIIAEKREQSISFTNIPEKAKVDDVWDMEATASSGLSVFFQVVSGDVYRNGNTVTLDKSGTIEIKATQAGNNEYAATEETIEISVEKKGQSITFVYMPEKVEVNDIIKLYANASSQYVVSFEIISDNASIIENSVTCSKAGILKIKATQKGDDRYSAAEATIEIVVEKKDQSIIFQDTPMEATINDELELDASASSGLEVSYEVISGDASISGKNIIFNKAENVIVKALQAGNDEYNEAEQSHLILVKKKEQSITFLDAPSEVSVKDVVELNATAGSELEVSFEVISGEASISGSEVTFNKAGTVEIKATQEGNDEYAATEETVEIKVEKKAQSITFENLPKTVFVGDVVELTASASSELEVSFEAVSEEASVSGNAVTFNKAGTIEIKAIQEGDDEFSGVEKTIEITVEKKEQNITFENLPERVKVKGVLELTANASSNLDLSFEVISGDASISGNVVTFNKAGTVEIKAFQTGDDEFSAAKKTIEFTVEKKEQSITFENLPEKVTLGDVLELEATASSGLEIEYIVASGDVWVTGNSFTFKLVETVQIVAIQEGNDVFKACEKTIEITVDFATGIEDIVETSTQIYPNPVENEMVIKFESSEKRTIYLFDLQGKLKLQKETSSSSERLNLSNFKSGMYLMKIQANNETFTYKIIKK